MSKFICLEAENHLKELRVESTCLVSFSLGLSGEEKLLVINVFPQKIEKWIPTLHFVNFEKAFDSVKTDFFYCIE